MHVPNLFPPPFACLLRVKEKLGYTRSKVCYSSTSTVYNAAKKKESHERKAKGN